MESWSSNASSGSRGNAAACAALENPFMLKALPPYCAGYPQLCQQNLWITRRGMQPKLGFSGAILLTVSATRAVVCAGADLHRHLSLSGFGGAARFHRFDAPIVATSVLIGVESSIRRPARSSSLFFTCRPFARYFCLRAAILAWSDLGIVTLSRTTLSFLSRFEFASGVGFAETPPPASRFACGSDASVCSSLRTLDFADCADFLVLSLVERCVFGK